MLSSILSKSDCASCKFCCSFRRQSLWETPLFDEETKNRLQEKNPGAKFAPCGTSSFTIFLSDSYKTDDSEEEAACPFLDAERGCVLSAGDKPFDCSIWPLRAMEKDGRLVVALTPTCPSIRKKPLSAVRNLVASGLGEKILSKARDFPDMVKPYRDGFEILFEQGGA